MDLEAKKSTARQWFEDLRDQLCTAFEALEAAADPDLYGEATTQARFDKSPWSRA